ncbi:MAG: hypothetical protein FK731_00325 [Asgard group archaeon]|nr:hypothetical protein [Asgard group archaeon]
MIGILTSNSNALLDNTKSVETFQTKEALNGYKMINLMGSSFLPSGGTTFMVTYLLEPYGLTAHNIAPENPLIDYYGDSFTDIDYLCSEVNVAEYDILTIPDDSNLTLYPDAMSIITEAYNEGLLIVALDKGPYLLAYLDLIEGKNITAYWEDGEGKIIIENAGATYLHPFDGPYVDLPFVTAYVNYQNLGPIIAAALGIDLTATMTLTTPTSEATIPIYSFVFLVSIALSAILYHKKKHH